MADLRLPNTIPEAVLRGWNELEDRQASFSKQDLWEVVRDCIERGKLSPYVPPEGDSIHNKP